ncbi:DUF3800 domain-containing protein [Streptomyces sp. H39-S7]|uniref:DUF3800 domain-containing protein n=1 Tax=Streptomyces sp. H39-S7 TaxID=3004357 RepID=UPI0022AEC2D2|nr:DUF3800 domain-containing protein [Streptomyces sp. H39-S7]MCZ4121994.1 DUF3800 domain-containing protein [Streptomyces sp. H39-S7]
MTGDREEPLHAAATGPLIEVACDESGSDGENLLGGNTDVFAHASVWLDVALAADSIQEIRNRIRSPAQEYKANHLLREKHRPVLTWLLGPLGPIHGHAQVHLTDKAFFVVGRAVDLLVGDATHAASAGLSRDEEAHALAVALYREGPRSFGPELWQEFLESANNLMRTKNLWGERTPVESFFRSIDKLRRAGAGSPLDGIMEQLAAARSPADSFRARLLDDPTLIPALDPLIPSIVRTVAHWSEGTRPVAIVHDRNNTLTEERIAQLKEIFSAAYPADPGYGPRGRLTSVTLVSSRSDARIQLADFLAGVARKIASDELNGRGDAELTGLLRPYVDETSFWGDGRSWSLLGPVPSARL